MRGAQSSDAAPQYRNGSHLLTIGDGACRDQQKYVAVCRQRWGKLHRCDFLRGFAFDRAMPGAFVLAKGEIMTAYYIRHNRRSRRIAFVYAGAISVAFVAGTFALVALLLGSPLEFGSALAICGTGWIVAHIAEQFAEQERTRRRLALESTRRAAPRVPRLVTFASARQYNHVLSRRPASASSRWYDRGSRLAPVS
jgi:hypothetical protein